MPWFNRDSFMKTGRSALQCGQPTCSAGEAGIARSPSQARHLKCIIGAMKPLLAMLLIAASVHAQSMADIARKERERQAKLRPTRVVTATTEVIKPEAAKPGTPAADQTKPADAKAASSEPAKEAPKPPTPPAADPVQAYNNQMNEIRKRIRALEDQQTSLQLQQNQATN